MRTAVILTYPGNVTNIDEVIFHQFQIWKISGSGKIVFLAEQPQDLDKQGPDKEDPDKEGHDKQAFKKICIEFHSESDAGKFTSELYSKLDNKSEEEISCETLKLLDIPDLSFPNVLY